MEKGTEIDTPASASIAPVQAQTYPRPELITRASEIFGVNPEIVIAALHGDDIEQLTIDGVKQKIKDFLERKAI